MGMANSERRPGRYGRISREIDAAVPRLETYITDHHLFGMGGQLPMDDPARDIDYCSQVGDFPMYLNDRVGDCTIAGAAHFFGAMCVYAGKPEPEFDDGEITRAYTAVSGYDPATGANDNGADMQAVLAYLATTGMTDTTGKVHKVAAYAAISRPADLDLAARVLNVFGTVYIGINAPQSMEDQFGAHQVLDYVPGSPVLGGHAIVMQRRQPGASSIWWTATWGEAVQATPAFYSSTVEEAWAVASEDFVEAAGSTVTGFSLAQLVADTAALHSA